MFLLKKSEINWKNKIFPVCLSLLKLLKHGDALIVYVNLIMRPSLEYSLAEEKGQL